MTQPLTSDLTAIAHWWALQYATLMRDNHPRIPHPAVAIAGHDVDVVANVNYGVFPDGLIGGLSWLTGYLGYPCDAVYTSAAWDLDHDTAICWTHLHPTSETVVVALEVDRNNKRFVPIKVDSDDWGSYHDSMLHSAHWGDGHALTDDVPFGRSLARDIVLRESGTVYVSDFLPSGTVLERARASARNV